MYTWNLQLTCKNALIIPVAVLGSVYLESTVNLQKCSNQCCSIPANVYWPKYITLPYLTYGGDNLIQLLLFFYHSWSIKSFLLFHLIFLAPARNWFWQECCLEQSGVKEQYKNSYAVFCVSNLGASEFGDFAMVTYRQDYFICLIWKQHKKNLKSYRYLSVNCFCRLCKDLMPLHTDTGPYSELACLLNLYVKLERSYFYEFYEKHFPGLSGSGLNSFKVVVQSQNWILEFTSISYYLTARDWIEKGAM